MTPLQRLALALYGLATWLAQPLLRRKLRRRARQEAGYAQAVGERFGRYGDDGPAQPGALLWIHAVSLGETRAAALLLRELRALQPGLRLLLTHGTATGRAEGAKLLQPGDVQVWLPWDTLGAVRRFVQRFRPAIGILMETEIWPNLAACCRAEGVPLVLANARLNEKSRRGAQRLAWLSRPAYAGLRAVWAQTEADAQRLREVGARDVQVLGNVKFDVHPDPEQLARGHAWRAAAARPVVLLASSREGEEALWLDAVGRLADADRRSVQWLIVPRHPQRFDAVEQLLRAAGLGVARRSQWPQQGDAPSAADVWLGDSMGEMALYYGLAQVALLGGSFERLGGQNLIEAAACGCPVVMGPHTFNFAQAAKLAAAAGAALPVADMAQAVAQALALAHDAPAWRQCVQQCQAFAGAHRGAARAMAQAALALLARP